MVDELKDKWTPEAKNGKCLHCNGCRWADCNCDREKCWCLGILSDPLPQDEAEKGNVTDCPFKVGDRIASAHYYTEAKVTAVTQAGFEYAFDEPVPFGRPGDTTTGGVCYPTGYHFWSKVVPGLAGDKPVVEDSKFCRNCGAYFSVCNNLRCPNGDLHDFALAPLVQGDEKSLFERIVNHVYPDGGLPMLEDRVGENHLRQGDEGKRPEIVELSKMMRCSRCNKIANEKANVPVLCPGTYGEGHRWFDFIEEGEQ